MAPNRRSRRHPQAGHGLPAMSGGCAFGGEWRGSFSSLIAVRPHRRASTPYPSCASSLRPYPTIQQYSQCSCGMHPGQSHLEILWRHADITIAGQGARDRRLLSSPFQGGGEKTARPASLFGHRERSRTGPLTPPLAGVRSEDGLPSAIALGMHPGRGTGRGRTDAEPPQNFQMRSPSKSTSKSNGPPPPGTDFPGRTL